MEILSRKIANGGAGQIVTTCPICGKGGSLASVADTRDSAITTADNISYQAGQRLCPNPECRALLFFVFQKATKELILYPKLRIDFDSSNLPHNIKSSFEEALTCHSEECYAASALMVRRTLEELCQDKNCEGNSLFQRIEALKDNVVIPQQLFDALDEIRLLGNDAAHVESKDYDNIGKEEVAIAIELTKEILKSVYQMDSLVAKLKAFKMNNAE